MMSQIMVDKARVEGMNELAEHLVALQEKIIDLSDSRLVICRGKIGAAAK